MAPRNISLGLPHFQSHPKKPSYSHHPASPIPKPKSKYVNYFKFHSKAEVNLLDLWWQRLLLCTLVKAHSIGKKVTSV